MGIRIHKTLGYGLANLKCKGYEIADKRINPEGILGLDYEEAEVVYSRANYAKWLRERYDACKDYSDDKLDLAWDMVDAEGGEKANPKTGNPEDCFIHQGEYGIPKVLNIIPYRCRFIPDDWYRYNSMLDYCEETAYFHKNENNPNRYKFLKDAIYPYLNYWDVRTGRIVKNEAFHFRRLVNSKAKEGFDMQRAAEDAGFANIKEAKKYMQPMVPRCVQLLCEFAKVFTDPATIRELRPMIYVYWC